MEYLPQPDSHHSGARYRWCPLPPHDLATPPARYCTFDYTTRRYITHYAAYRSAPDGDSAGDSAPPHLPHHAVGLICSAYLRCYLLLHTAAIHFHTVGGGAVWVGYMPACDYAPPPDGHCYHHVQLPVPTLPITPHTCCCTCSYHARFTYGALPRTHVLHHAAVILPVLPPDSFPTYLHTAATTTTTAPAVCRLLPRAVLLRVTIQSLLPHRTLHTPPHHTCLELHRITARSVYRYTTRGDGGHTRTVPRWSTTTARPAFYAFAATTTCAYRGWWWIPVTWFLVPHTLHCYLPPPLHVTHHHLPIPCGD